MSDDHWLVRPDTIRKLWVAFIAILVLTVAAELFVDWHPHFAVESIPGFNAWYGLGSCIALIVFARGLGYLLKRPDDYYETVAVTVEEPNRKERRRNG